MTDTDAAADSSSGAARAADEPPPPVAYTEPVTGPVRGLLVWGVVSVSATVLGLWAGAAVSLLAWLCSALVADHVDGGAALEAATSSVLAAGLLWGVWRSIRGMRGDGSLSASALKVCVWAGTLPILVLQAWSLVELVGALIG